VSDDPTFEADEAVAAEAIPGKGPCPDCAKAAQAYARAGMLVGASAGIAVGVAIAYLVVRNRLA
jgi:hypothetical protein